jgi:Uma2 family endonuclease
MGDFVRMVPKVTLEQFHAFRDERPKEEKWELIAGVPHMMPPPSLKHQRIAGNLERLLDDRLRLVRRDWRADREIGILVPEDDTYNPEPDVTVIDRAVEDEQIYAERFYFVAEVLSPNDKSAVLALKMAFYRQHDYCRGVLFVRQDRVAADLHLRDSDWELCELRAASDRLVIAEIGDIGVLGSLYRDTHLWRPEFDTHL